MATRTDRRTLPLLGDFIANLAAVEHAGSGTGERFRVSGLSFDLPVELDLEEGSDGSLRLGASTPTQWVATTVMPVFHRMRLGVEAVEV